MSLTILSILLLCIQPFVIYNSMFRERKIKDKKDLESELSLLVIAPSFIFFYLDVFWYALFILISISLLGVLFAKILAKKAKRSLPSKELFTFMLAWVLIFSMGYGAVNLWQYVSGDSTDHITQSGVNLSATDVPTSEIQTTNITKTPLLPNLLPSLYYLLAMICVIFIKAFEARSETKEKLSGILLLLLSVSGSIFPFFSEYYLLSLVFNFIVFIGLAPVVIRYKETDPSVGGIMFFYGYAFVMATGLSLMCQGIMWLLSY
ncbi:hypothetical protein ACPUVO_13910 [Pseudocolwellia sp. HL-MZ19]|uniref:hypothetical protein n=1 Tax=Pseudocolwellia sp. HL-MZ19 TaxID=3400846 RepID=UPI003CF563BA